MKCPKEFEIYRGGCIVCMDYNYWFQDINMLEYTALMSKFDLISNILLTKLKRFQTFGFLPSNGYMVGHSFGSQLAIDAGRNFNGSMSGIDGCVVCICIRVKLKECNNNI